MISSFDYPARTYRWGGICCIFLRWHAHCFWVLGQDCVHLGCINRTASWVSPARTYRLGEICCIFPRWHAHCFWVSEQDGDSREFITRREVGAPLQGKKK